MLTQAGVEAEMDRLISAAEDVARDVAARAEDAARREHEYKVAYAQALLRAAAKTVGDREAQALLAVEDQHLARKVADARLLAAQETARMVRAQLDALRSVNSNLRGQVGVETW